MAFKSSDNSYVDNLYRCIHSISLCAQGTIEIQFSKPLRVFRTFQNSPLRMADNNNSVLRCSRRILSINVKFYRANSAEHNTSTIIKHNVHLIYPTSALNGKYN